MSDEDQAQAPEFERAATATRRRVMSSQDILQGEREVLIDHHGEVYRLRETRNGKLILGK